MSGAGDEKPIRPRRASRKAAALSTVPVAAAAVAAVTPVVPEDKEEKRYRLYLEMRKQYDEASHKHGATFDEKVFFFCGSGLGISLVFIHNVVTPGHVIAPCVLGIGWSLLVLTIIGVLLNVLLCQQANQRFHDILDLEYHNGEPETYGARVRAEQDKHKPSNWIKALNWIMLVTFGLGVVLVLLFAIINLSNTKGATT